MSAYLNPLDDGVVVAGEGDCWLEMVSPMKLDVGFSFGRYHASSCCAAFVCREIVKRFGATRYGSDATGWYPESDLSKPQFKEDYGNFDSWVHCLKNYDLKQVLKVHGLDRLYVPLATRRVIKEVEAAVVAVFADLDAKETPCSR